MFNDYEVWLNKFYQKNAPGWIIKCTIQRDQYEWMADKLGHVVDYVHLEDIDLIREIWGVW